MSQTVLTNRFTNPRATATTNWSAVAGTGGTAALTNVTTGGPASPSVPTFNRVTWSAATTAVSGGISTDTTAGAAFTAGTQTIAMMVRSSKAQTVALTAQLYNGATATTAATGASVALTAGTWTLVSVTVTAAATDTRVTATVAAVAGGSNWASSDTLDGTAALAVQGSAGTYFDGSYTNANSVMYAWTGTANASTSTATTYTPAIALTAATDAPCPRVTVTLTDLTPTDNTVNVWRTADGVRTAVRGARGTTVNGSTAITDYEAPLGRSVAYDLEVTAGLTVGTTAPTATVTVTPPADSAGKATWWIQDPLVPSSAIALSVTKGDSSRPYLTAAAVKSLEYDADITVIPIIGSKFPVAVGGQRLAASGVDFSVFTNAAQAATNLRNLLAQAAVLLIRPPGNGREAGLPGLAYTAMAKPSEQPVTVAFGGTLTRWSLTGHLAAAPLANVLVPVWTYGNVSALWTTYQQAQTALAAKTYLDVLKSPTGA